MRRPHRGAWRTRRAAIVPVILVLLAAACTGPTREPAPLVPTPPGVDEPDTIDAPPYRAPHDRPGPAADRIRFRSFHVDRAALELGAGNMDLYLFSLKTVAAQRLRDDPGVLLYPAPATTFSLVLNPAPAPQGQLNPFSILEIRQAMQQLVDRDFITRDLFHGLASPMVTHVTPHDFDFLTVHDIALSAGVAFDPELARARIAGAMEEAGADLVDGVWHYEGRPVRLRFVARVEDERREISDLIRAELERAGFSVAISYQPFAPAVLQVYATDPQAFEWHLYTEGWGRGSATRYDFGTVNQMTAPWLGNMPGWREVGFWQYEHDEIDELGQRLFRGEFSSLEERNEIYREMTRIGLEESVRIWLATAVNHFPARSDVVGISRDPVAGPRGLWTLREAHLPGTDELTVGHLWVWTERTTWNPIGGFGDVYSVDVYRNLHDPPLWNHPFSGIPMAFRADFEVDTAGPGGTLPVPQDAVIWDAASDRWVEVGSGVTAVSRVMFDYSRYVDSVWHHGQPITMADILYPIAQGHDLAYDPDKSRIEVALAVTARPYLETFRGFRVLDDRHLEVYVDYWHFEENHIAAYASPSSVSMPWEVLAAMDALVFDERRAAYSDTAAARFNVPWLSLVMERDARLVQRTLLGLLDGGTPPAGVFDVGSMSLVEPADAAARYRAALDWFETHRHLVISNGPFTLARYDPPAQLAELEAFRHESYPFRPGDWYFGDPPLVRIGEVHVPPLAAGREAEVTVEVAGPGTVGVQFVLLDVAGRTVVASGPARHVDGTRFAVALPSLPAGLYRLELAAHSDQVALLGERRVDLDVR